jgi:hypothetical protein
MRKQGDPLEKKKKGRTPRALPRKNRAEQSMGNVVAKEAEMPKSAVKNRVALNAGMRPTRSESMESKLSSVWHTVQSDAQVPHPTAPNIIPANILEDKIPIWLSRTGQIVGRKSRHAHINAL